MLMGDETGLGQWSSKDHMATGASLTMCPRESCTDIFDPISVKGDGKKESEEQTTSRR